MANPTYARLAKRTTGLLKKYGATLVLRGDPTTSDPVSGAGGADGAARDVIGVLASVKDGYFTLTLAPESAATVGEVWVDGADEWPLIEVKTIKPDNETVIAYRALVRG